MKSGFLADENGIFKVDTAVSKKMKMVLRENLSATLNVNDHFTDSIYTPEVPIVISCHYKVGLEEGLNNEYVQSLRRVWESTDHTELDSLLPQYNDAPINEDGFYGIPFKTKVKGKGKVLLLGDSFTWGHSAKNKTGSFANTLLSRGYAVFNTGISGADVAQYKKVLEIYMDVIDPDIVILNFYMGNDVSYFERIPTTGIPIHFSTNAGNLIAFQNGIQYLNMEDTYKNIMTHSLIPQTTTFNKVSSSTVIGTLIWMQLERKGFVRREYHELKPRPEMPYCNTEIASMQKLCEAKNTRFVLAVIPHLKDGVLDGAKTVEQLFDGIAYHEPNVTLEMYDQGDGHFNDEGHLFYADFLEDLIQKEFHKN